MRKNNDEKIIQIIEIKNEVYAVYKNEDWVKGEPTFWCNRVLFGTLNAQGFISMVDIDDESIFDSCDQTSNFSHYHFGDPSKIKLPE